MQGFAVLCVTGDTHHRHRAENQRRRAGSRRLHSERPEPCLERQEKWVGENSFKDSPSAPHHQRRQVNALGDLDACSHPHCLRTVTVHDFDALAPHFAAWDRLAWKAPQRLPTLLPAWVDAFLRHKLKPNERWLCSFAYIGDHLVGVLPVIATPHRLLGSSWPTLRTPSDAHTVFR